VTRSNKRVCMLSISPILFDSRIQQEAKTLRDEGYKVTIICIEDQQSISSLAHLEDLLFAYDQDMRGIDTKRFFLKSRDWRWLPKVIHKTLQAIELFLRFIWAVTVHRADIYHCHDLTPGIFAIWGKVFHQARVIYDAHELEVQAKRKLAHCLQTSYEKLLSNF
jgi:Glycosyl transferase 4-like